MTVEKFQIQKPFISLFIYSEKKFPAILSYLNM